MSVQKPSGVIVSHLVAAAENNGIGIKNQLPWNLPNDFKYFKNKTWGMPVIMGRKTFESMDKLLPGRVNVIITSNKEWKREGAIVAHSLPEAIEEACKTDCKELFIIGGGEIFRQSMEITDRIYITRVHAVIDADTFYPTIDESIFKLVSTDPHPADEKHQYAYDFQVWERMKS
jgi:dihydrofolate reductase